MRVFACGILLAAAFAAGCGRKEPVSSDPAVRAAQVAQAEANCRRLGQSMNELTAKVRAKLGTDDPAKVMAELEKSPEWKRLTAELQQRSEALAELRQ